MSFWSDVRLDLLRALIAEGASATQAARELGGTRSQMIGKAARIGLRFHSMGGGTPVDKSKRPKLYVPRPTRAALDANPSGRALGGGKIAALFVAPPERPEKLVSLFDLRASDCRFPYGSPRDHAFGFCGREVREGSSYCPGHHALCRVPVKTAAETKAPAKARGFADFLRCENTSAGLYASWERRRA